MKKNELTEFLQRQNEFLQGRLDEALASVSSLTLANEKLVATVDELRRQIASLEDVIKGRGAELSKEKAARQAVQRLQGSPSERQTKPMPAPAVSETPEQRPQKKRTNNGARRKTHPECEVETVVVEPDSPDFNPEAATFIGECDVVRYVAREHNLFNGIYSFTTVGNHRSERVMQKIGMQREGFFFHPALPEGHRLKPHILYRLELKPTL